MVGISNGVNGMMSIRLKTRGKYFKFPNLESILMNDMKKLFYSGVKIGDIHNIINC